MLHGLQQGNEVLKEIHKELNIENVERIMEETAEAREYQRVSRQDRLRGRGNSRRLQEIDEMLAGSLSLEDEEAVQAELHELQLETVSRGHATGEFIAENLAVGCGRRASYQLAVRSNRGTYGSCRGYDLIYRGVDIADHQIINHLHRRACGPLPRAGARIGRCMI